MECQNCGAAVEDGSKFCPGCGKAVAGSASGQVGNEGVQIGSRGRTKIYYGKALLAKEVIKFVDQLFTSKNMETKVLGGGSETIVHGKEKFSWGKMVLGEAKVKIAVEGNNLSVTVGDNTWIYVTILSLFIGIIVHPVWIFTILTPIKYYGTYPAIRAEIERFILSKN